MDSTCSEHICPACGCRTSKLTQWEYSGLNDSIFNYVAEFYHCPECGLVYVENITDSTLATFYETECSYFEKPHFDINATENIRKYKAYRDIIIGTGLCEPPFADIGCGRGGFITWLNESNWQSDCTGVDIDMKSIPTVNFRPDRKRSGLTFREGNAFDLPFADGAQSLLTYFHVFEHIRDLERVLREANRVLRDGGHILIEVPDAERYHVLPIGTAFWASIREHINHFSACALSRILQRHGFRTVSVHRQILPTPEFSYPSLIIVGRKHSGPANPSDNNHQSIASFVIASRQALNEQAQRLTEFCSNYSRTTFWGCSAELLSLLPLIDLQRVSLCDASTVKQKSMCRGIPIQAPASVERTGVLIVAPYLHGNAIEKSAISLGWPPDAIFRLR